MGSLVKDNKCFEKGVSQSDLGNVSSQISSLTNEMSSLNGEVSSLNTQVTNKLGTSGGTLTGNLRSQDIVPNTDRQYYCGTPGSIWAHVYSNEYNFPKGRIHNNENIIVIGVFDCLTVRDSSDDSIFRPISASAFNVMSSRRYKKNIRDMTDEEANKVLEIRPKVFDYLNESNGIGIAGAIAEEVFEVLPQLVTLKRIDGVEVPDSIDYSKFSMYLLKQVQMLRAEIEDLKGKMGY